MVVENKVQIGNTSSGGYVVTVVVVQRSGVSRLIEPGSHVPVGSRPKKTKRKWSLLARKCLWNSMGRSRLRPKSKEDKSEMKKRVEDASKGG